MSAAITTPLSSSMTTASAFPVLLKRVSGVFGTLVVAEPLDTVAQLIALLNAKLAASPQDEQARLKSSIRFSCTEWRSRRRENSRLSFCNKRMVPHVWSRSPRGSPRVSVKGDSLFVNIHGGKTLILAYDPKKLVQEVKEQVFFVDGIPTRAKRMLSEEFMLSEGKTLAECGVEPESTIYSALDQVGGGGGPRAFADVSDGYLLLEHQFSNKAPAWRACDTGLNVEGRCTSPTCKAFKPFKPFNLVEV